MVETLAKWMATSEKWLKNKNGMGVTVKKFTKKEGIFFFELDVPEKYSRFKESLAKKRRRKNVGKKNKKSVYIVRESFNPILPQMYAVVTAESINNK